MNIIMIDLRDQNEAEKFVLLNPASNLKILENYLENGRTEIGYDEETGDIILAVEKGKLIYAQGKTGINFKRIS